MSHFSLYMSNILMGISEPIKSLSQTDQYFTLWLKWQCDDMCNVNILASYCLVLMAQKRFSLLSLVSLSHQYICFLNPNKLKTVFLKNPIHA